MNLKTNILIKGELSSIYPGKNNAFKCIMLNSDNSKYELDDYIQIDNSKYYSMENLNSRPKKYFSSNKELIEALKTATEEEKQMYSWEIKRETISLE